MPTLLKGELQSPCCRRVGHKRSPGWSRSSVPPDNNQGLPPASGPEALLSLSTFSCIWLPEYSSPQPAIPEKHESAREAGDPNTTSRQRERAVCRKSFSSEASKPDA